jgi:hypothetical protein
MAESRPAIQLRWPIGLMRLYLAGATEQTKTARIINRLRRMSVLELLGGNE